jgi:hypothetical protein
MLHLFGSSGRKQQRKPKWLNGMADTKPTDTTTVHNVPTKTSRSHHAGWGSVCNKLYVRRTPFPCPPTSGTARRAVCLQPSCAQCSSAGSCRTTTCRPSQQGRSARMARYGPSHICAWHDTDAMVAPRVCSTRMTGRLWHLMPEVCYNEYPLYAPCASGPGRR